MKIIALLFLVVSLPVSSQDMTGKELYRKYSGTKGIVSMVIPGFVVRWAALLPEIEPDIRQIMRNMGTVRILTVEDEDLNRKVNFYDEIGNSYDKKRYEELLVMREKDSDVRMLVNEKEGIIRELVIIMGGEDNAFVSITGKITHDDLAAIARSVRENKGTMF